MNKLALLAASAAASMFLQNCAKSPAGEVSGTQEVPSIAQAKSDSLASAMLLSAYDLNRDAASHRRLISMKSSAAEPDLKPGTQLPVFGSAPAAKSATLAPKPRPSMVGALLKSASGGLAKSSASAAALSTAAPDSAYLVLADSAKGYIQWVHEYAIVEAGSSVEARDTLMYKWPYSPSNITVLGHTGSRAHANGSLLRYAITDEDGDKILNEAVAPKPIRLQKLWITVHGDTTWKTTFHTSHGSTTYYDSIGEGSPTS